MQIDVGASAHKGTSPSSEGPRAPGSSTAANAPAVAAPTLLTVQLLFNIGFYSVVPFIAVVGNGDLALSSATGFLVLAGGSFAPLASEWRAASIGIAAALITLGHLAANPTAMHLVIGFASGSPMGSYFGLLASFGGIAVLLGNLAAGRLFDSADAPWAVLPWVFLAALPVVSALLLPRVLGARSP